MVMHEILPVWTYSCLVMLIPVFLLTDYLRHKPVIVFHGLILIINFIIIIFGQGVLVMQFVFFVYGMVAATNVAYYSYIYSVVSSEHYQKVTSYCRSVTLVGQTLGSVLGQVLVSVGNVSYFYLNVISLVSVSVAFLTSILLPMPKGSIFFHREEAENIQGSPSTEAVQPTSENISPQNNLDTTTLSQLPVMADEEVLRQNVDGLAKAIDHHSEFKVFRQLWSDFKECYSSPQLLCWSTWWVLATCGYYQILSCVQALWDYAEPSQNAMVYNGGAESVSNLVGAATSFAIGYIKLDLAIWGELALAIFSAVNSGVLYAMALSNNIWVCYACYVVFKGSYMLLITIATCQIAVDLNTGHHALTFGVNTSVALAIQTILTIVVVDSRGLGLDIITQVLIYGSYFAGISGFFLITAIYTFIQTGWKGKRQVGSEINGNPSLSRNDIEITEQF